MSGLHRGKLKADASAVAVVMAGGQGTRFWPSSRSSRPKQFLPVPGSSRSFIQATVDRLVPVFSHDEILVVSSLSQMGLVCEHLPDVALLCEPFGRNTATCVGYAAELVLKQVGDVPMVCLPADHLISNTNAFLEVLSTGVRLAQGHDALVTIGVKPDRPETGYGYIRRGDQTAEHGVFQVLKFVEKPSKMIADEYVRSGDYYWNSGMFVWRPSVIRRAIDEHLPDLGRCLREIGSLIGGDNEERGIEKIFSEIVPVSIDVGVLEREPSVLMLCGDGFQWSDVGSWDAWASAARYTKEGSADRAAMQDNGQATNQVIGDGLCIDCKNATIVGGHRFIATVGLDDILVIDAGDALLVCDRKSAQDVKAVVDALKEMGREDLL